jgi:hypothetical protein
LSIDAKSSAGFILYLFFGVCSTNGNERFAFKTPTTDGCNPKPHLSAMRSILSPSLIPCRKINTVVVVLSN